MTKAVVPFGTSGELVLTCPRIITDAGDRATRRFVEFFAVTIRNPNTRESYARAVAQFLAWCEERHLTLHTIEPIVVAAYVEQHPGSKPTVKQHLAAIRMLFDWLVTGQVVPTNPATSVRGPRHVVKKGKTPVLSADEARALLSSIDTSTLTGLRDRALIGTMIYSFARVGAVVGMRVGDYYHQGRRSWLRLNEKGGKHHEVPAHHNAVAYLDAYLDGAGIVACKTAPLWQTVAGRSGKLTGLGMSRRDALAMVKRRAAAAGLSERVNNHTFRATGITVYLKSNGATLEKAQAIAAHESPRTTKLYDRTVDEVSLDEIERIVL